MYCEICGREVEVVDETTISVGATEDEPEWDTFSICEECYEDALAEQDKLRKENGW
jgi:hypothetical protein